MAKGENVKGVTTKGFNYVIDAEAFDDYETFEKICALDRDENNIALVTEVFEAMLGKEQYKELKEFMRKENGRISTRDMIDTLSEILNGEDEEIKNL